LQVRVLPGILEGGKMAFPSTMIVYFESAMDAEDACRDLDLYSVETSTLMPRYAIEVPVGREQEIAAILKEKYGAKVNDVFLTANRSKKKRSA
jgi:hypothetical protein